MNAQYEPLHAGCFVGSRIPPARAQVGRGRCYAPTPMNLHGILIMEHFHPASTSTHPFREPRLLNLMAKPDRHNSKKRTLKGNPSSTARPAVNDSFPIVGIGASAGGLEAVTQLLKALPSNPGLALVLVQHLDPTHESALTSILARSTALSVTEAKHNMRLTPNCLYVIPPNKLLKIHDGRLKLSPRHEAESPPAVDYFFRALAECEGRRAIGVILSGNGSDGTQGCLAIKSAGGITMAQEEKSAKYPAMPGSAITAGCVDFVLPPDRIARELARLAGHPYVTPPQRPEEPQRPAEERAAEQVLLLLRQQMGVDFTQYKPMTLRRRMQRRMALHKLESLKSYADYLRANATEVKELYDDILIHVTGFFRDPAVFQALKKKVFPRLVRQKAPEDPVRVWVPGCSTGEEVYSLAITLIEFLAEHKLRHPVQIFGTDIHDAALESARAGVYPASIRGDVSSERLRRFFAKADGSYRINKHVREMCVFARQNVAVDPPFSNIDLISCRNLLIYLGQPLQLKVLPLFHYALRPDAFLVLGASETVGGFADLFALLDKKTRIYVRKASRLRPSMSFGAPRVEPPPAARTEPASHPAIAHLSDVQRQADRILLTHFSPAGVLINRDMDVLQFRGQTGPYLEHRSGEATLNLVKMAREGLGAELRSAVSQALKKNSRVRHEGCPGPAERRLPRCLYRGHSLHRAPGNRAVLPGAVPARGPAGPPAAKPSAPRHRAAQCPPRNWGGWRTSWQRRASRCRRSSRSRRRPTRSCARPTRRSCPATRNSRAPTRSWRRPRKSSNPPMKS